jgi:hypothetical protein
MADGGRGHPRAMTYDRWDILVRTAAVVATAVGLALPGGWRRRVAPLARRPWATMGVVAIVSLVVNGGVAIRQGMPRPRVHDEFAYLLAADTFAHGRLANPTPACADSFQSPHVLVRPTYAAKYPPGQGVALAVGQLLGRPIYGVWISNALAAMAVAWMVAAFAGPEWALLGGLVAAAHPQMVDWGHVFWGGSVAVVGGALAVGAWGRVRGRQVPGVGPAILLGVGLSVLANSRPYEGLVLTVPLLATLAPRWRRLGPTLAVLLVGAAAMAFYNGRVTGHALRMPFADYAARFDVYPKFWFQPRRSLPIYPNGVMAEVHTVKERGRFDLLQTWPGRWQTAVEWSRRLWLMHARPTVLLVPLAASLLVRRARPVWAAVIFFLLGLMAENWFLPHYAAPVVPTVLLLMVLGWQRLAEWDGPAAGFVRRLGRGAAVGFFVAAGLSAMAPADPDLRRFTRDDLLAERPELAAGRQLVFVRYGVDHPVEDEWVYNGADVASQPIVWVRSLGPAEDRAVAAAYGPRRDWVLTVGKSTHALTAWPVP